jgi:hypothetical protein
MEIVLGAFRLASPGGTEHYTLTVAEQLQRLGHEVTIYVEQPGEIADLARSRGLRLATREDELPDDADVLYAQESVTAYGLAARYPKAPLVVGVHSVEYDLSLPPQLPELVSALVTLHDRVTRRAEAFAVKAEIVRLRQPVDTARFTPRGSLHERPQRVLALGNYLRGDRARVIEAACAEAGLEAMSVGMQRGNHVLEADRVLNEADVVLGKGRVIVEAMACGRAAYVFDAFGSDGWVTNDSYARLEADNFGGLTGTPPVDVARLRSDLELYRTDMGAANRELSVVHHPARTSTRCSSSSFSNGSPRAQRPARGRCAKWRGSSVSGGRARSVNGAIVGRTPRLAGDSSGTGEDLGPTILDDGAVVCAGAIVFAGARIGRRAIVGDQAHVRERTTLGPESVLGRGSALGSDGRSARASGSRRTSG